MFRDLEEAVARFADTGVEHAVQRTTSGHPIVTYRSDAGTAHTLVPDALLAELATPISWVPGARELGNGTFIEMLEIAQRQHQALIAGPETQPVTQAPQEIKLQGKRPTPVTYQATEQKENRIARFLKTRKNGWFLNSNPKIGLNQDQVNAVKVILTTENQFILVTGPAGSGKSVLTQYLSESQIMVPTAMTGRASINVGGRTIDSVFGLQRNPWRVRSWSKLENVMRQLPKYIGIDEASMNGLESSLLIIEIAKKFNKRIIQICDYAQAAPVKDAWNISTALVTEADYLYLNTSERQKDSNDVQVLNKIRKGQTDGQVKARMDQCIGEDKEEEGCIRMEATNRATNAYNSKRYNRFLEETKETPIPLKAVYRDVRSDHLKNQYPLKDRTRNEHIDRCPITDGQSIALGVQVLLTANNHEGGYVNGDVGVLKDVRFLGKIEEPKKPETEEKPNKGSDVKKRLEEKKAVGTTGGNLSEIISQTNEDGFLGKKKPAYSLVERAKVIQQKAIEQGKASGLKPLMWSDLTDEQKAKNLVYRMDPKHLLAFYVEVIRTEDRFEVEVCHHTVEIPDAKGVTIAEVTGFPIRLGFCMTIHKTQGQTVERAYLNAESIRAMPRDSQHGLFYVGVSRVRNLNGLTLSGYSPDLVYCDPKVLHLL